MVKMVALGAITEIIGSGVTVVPDGPVEQIARLLNLIPNLGKIDQIKWRAVFFNQVFYRYPMKSQVPITQIKSLLGEIVALLYKIKIGVLHQLIHNTIL
jgi:hypothetical protein